MAGADSVWLTPPSWHPGTNAKMAGVRRLLCPLASVGVALALGGCTSAPAPTTPPELIPPMGWNLVELRYAADTTSERQSTIDSMVSSGMRDAGYRYRQPRRGLGRAHQGCSNGNLRADPDKFPDGIAGIARYAHDRGLFLGLYASPFNEICGQDPRVAAPTTRRSMRTCSPSGVWTTSNTIGAGSTTTTTSRSNISPRCGCVARQRQTHHLQHQPETARRTRAPVSRYNWFRDFRSDPQFDRPDPGGGDDTLWQQGLAGVRLEFAAAIPVAARSRPGYWNDPDMMVVGIPWGVFAAGHPSMLFSLSLPDTVTLSEVSTTPVPQQIVNRVADQRPNLTDVEQRRPLFAVGDAGRAADRRRRSADHGRTKRGPS